MPNSVPAENGTRAERAAARKYGLEVRDSPNGYWDAKHRTNGRKVQVKSARYERADFVTGVFRVWREHLQDLRDVGGSVVVVVVNPSNDHRKVLRVQKVSPSLLLDVGDFRPTGQQDMEGMHEARIPWPDVVDL